MVWAWKVEAEECERLRISDLGVLLQGLSFLLVQQAQLCFKLLAEISQVAVGALQGFFLGKQMHHVLLHSCCLLPGCCPLHFSIPSTFSVLSLLTFRLKGKEKSVFFCSILPSIKVTGRLSSYWPAVEFDWVPPCLWRGLHLGQPFWPENLLGQLPDSAIWWELIHAQHSGTPSVQWIMKIRRICSLRKSPVRQIKLPGTDQSSVPCWAPERGWPCHPPTPPSAVWFDSVPLSLPQVLYADASASLRAPPGSSRCNTKLLSHTVSLWHIHMQIIYINKIP